jgi:hypothetical protein
MLLTMRHQCLFERVAQMLQTAGSYRRLLCLLSSSASGVQFYFNRPDRIFFDCIMKSADQLFLVAHEAGSVRPQAGTVCLEFSSNRNRTRA